MEGRRHERGLTSEACPHRWLPLTHLIYLACVTGTPADSSVGAFRSCSNWLSLHVIEANTEHLIHYERSCIPNHLICSVMELGRWVG